MQVQKNIRLSVAVFSVLFVLLFAIPSSQKSTVKSRDFSLLNYKANTEINSQSRGSDDIEKYERPTYFNIFKFICSFIPNRQKHSGKMMDISSELLTKFSGFGRD